MSGKYMKLKRIIIPTITMILLASQLMGCSATDTQQAMNMLQESEQIELEYAVPDDGTNIGDNDQAVQSLFWIQLASLETHPELRTAFEESLGVEIKEDGLKYGIIYTDARGALDQNNILFNAIGNYNFKEFIYGNNFSPGEVDTFEEIANNEYTDLEDNESIPAVINAYFELLPDTADREFSGSATLSRAQAMTLVMRATTPVNENGTPDSNADFTSAVGNSIYTDFASSMDAYAFVSTDNGQLDATTFSGAMSRGEYIYLLTNALFGDTYAEHLASQQVDDESLNNSGLTTIKNAGSISLQEAIQSPENGIPTDMYNTLARAVALGFIDEETLNWDDAITKSDAIQLLMDAILSYYQHTGYLNASQGTTLGVNSEGLTVDEALHLDNEYARSVVGSDLIEDADAYARSQGADEMYCAWLVYYYGSAAGDQRSYAINMRTGEKIIAGPNTFFYGTSMDNNGATPFFGSGAMMEYKGELYSEYFLNMSFATGLYE